MKKTKSLLFILLVVIFKFNAAASSPQYINGTDTLVVYSSIPNLPVFVPKIETSEKKDIRTFSDKFTIRVRSAATNNVWVNVHAFYTYSRALDILDLNQTNGSNSTTSVQNYPNATAGWSHTYGNIEMSRNQPVEVEIAPVINGTDTFKIDGKSFYKATVHPAQKSSAVTIVNGKIYFTINDPTQVAIDINGQMDDHNPFNGTPIAPPTDGVSTYTVPLHTITFFANPVIKKPTLNNSRTFYVVDGQMPTVSPTTYDTLYFMPGVHDIGLDNKIYPGKSVYIPGDAIIFGSLNNAGVPIPSGFTKIGEKIKIYGYGTISGARIKHPSYDTNTSIHEPINIDNALNYQISGITLADGAHFSLWTPGGGGGLVTYVKVIGWRANGDGLGNGDNVNDCFVRTNDDASYVRGNRKRVTYWKDNISAIFYMAQIWTTPILIEDCDILYCRARGGGGAAWDMRADQTAGVKSTQATFRNIRFHDPKANMTIFNLVTFKGTADAPTQVGQSYNWIKFENISIKSSAVKSNLLGCAAAPWNGGLTFDNVTYDGTLLTQSNLNTYFNTNQYVNSMIFKSRVSYSITTSVNGGVGGTVTGAGSYAQGAAATVSAITSAGYKFVNWTENGVSVSTNLSYTFTVTQNSNLVANFVATNYTLTETSPNGYVTFYLPGGTYAPGDVVTVTAVPNSGAYVFSSWGGDLSGSANPTTITMNSNKSISANFIAAPLPNVSELSAWVSGITNNKVAGSNRLMTVMVMGESNANFGANTVTYGGQTMVKQSEKLYYVSGNRSYASIFTLNETGVNAATSGTIAVTWSATPSVGNSIYSVLLGNVNQTTSVSASANNALSFTSITTTALAAAAGDMVIMCGATENDVIQTFNNGFTKKFESNSTWGDGVGGNKLGAGVNETPSFTQSASGRMALCAIVVKKASAPMAAPSITTNVIDVAHDNVISIYPNPVSSILNVDFSNADMSKEIKVFNLFGQLVYSTKTQSSNVQINIQTLNLKGVALVQVVEGNSMSSYRVIVK